MAALLVTEPLAMEPPEEEQTSMVVCFGLFAATG